MRPMATRVGELVDTANPYIRIIRKEDGRPTDRSECNRSLSMWPMLRSWRRSSGKSPACGRSALIVRADPLFTANRDRIARSALKHALPTLAEGRQFVSSGCLASYAPKFSAQSRGMAVLVDKILEGAKPGDLPIEQPREFELAINLEDRESPRHHRPAINTAARGRGDPVMRRCAAFAPALSLITNQRNRSCAEPLIR